jgi:hypothetical protein
MSDQEPIQWTFHRVRQDMLWRDLEKTRPIESAGEIIAGRLLVIVSVCGLLYAISRFF